MADCQCCGICGCELEADANLSDYRTKNLLEEQLNVIFILKHIYELKSEQLVCYLQKLGHPGEWLKFCRKCEEDVLNIRRVFEQLHKISRKFEEGKRALEEKIKYSEARKSEMTTKSKAVLEEALNTCRQKNANRCRPAPPLTSANSFEAGDRRASDLAMAIEQGLQDDLHYSTKIYDDLFQFDEPSSSSAQTSDFHASEEEHEEKEKETNSQTQDEDQQKMTTTERPLHSCRSCGKSFSTSGSLRRHTKWMVCLLPRFTCKKCVFRCETKKLLIEHLRQIHGIIRPMRPYGNYELDLSMVTLSEDKKSGTCNICRKQYDTIRKLKEHVKAFHSGLFYCSWESCEKTYLSEKSLRHHIKTCHNF